MKELEEKFKNMHLLDRIDRQKLIQELQILKPDFIKPYFPKWLWWRRCTTNVLIVSDGPLNFGTGALGLSEFLMAFNQLQATTWNDYKITLGHRSTSVLSSNQLVIEHKNNFNFTSSVNLSDFDQVWLFGFNTTQDITIAEVNSIEAYMNSGGGLFATGDHGYLGIALCGNIPRVKDMRYWTDNPIGSTDNVNEVGMTGQRRNDTNRPAVGASTSLFFDNQSDNIPQTIAPRIFTGGIPHPLLSINSSLRSSKIIDIMPDHPHEGECKPETSFIVNGLTIPTQIIATSFVLSGSTIGGGNGKALTQPHCFPSIAVWDGNPANVGRIVVDSTWHHFINVNLNGADSDNNGVDIIGIETGLTTSDLNVIRQYFMNISTWMTRRKSVSCWRRFILFDLFKNSQIIEASLDNPGIKKENISLADLNSIGSLAEEILSSKYNPALARTILFELMDDFNPSFSNILNVWKPNLSDEKNTKKENYYQPWINSDLILLTSIGAGFIALRDDDKTASSDFSEKDLKRISEVFTKGLTYGFELATKDLFTNFNIFKTTTKLNNK